MKRKLILMLSSVLMILASCSKDNANSSTTAIQGTYKLKSLSAKTNSTISGSEGEKMITVSDYTSINNTGTIVIDGSKFAATGLGYEVNSSAMAYYYEDNALVDSFSTPVNIIIPPSTSVSPYNLIGADSIYFQNGALTGGLAGNGTISSSGGGGKYSLSGNLLTLKSNYSSDSTIQESGEVYHKVESAQVTILLEKQ